MSIKEAQSRTAWMAECAAVLVNRQEVGREGKPPYQRAKGRTVWTPNVEFGDIVMH